MKAETYEKATSIINEIQHLKKSVHSIETVLNLEPYIQIMIFKSGNRIDFYSDNWDALKSSDSFIMPIEMNSLIITEVSEMRNIFRKRIENLEKELENL